MDELYRAFADRPDVKIVAVANGTEGRISSIRADKKLALPLPLGTDEFRDAFGVEAFPETILIDRKGRIAQVVKGGESYGFFKERMDALLAETDDDVATVAAAGNPGHPWWSGLVYLGARFLMWLPCIP